MLKIWERYFLKEIIKFTLFFIFSFYLLYITVDYSSKSGSFSEGKFSLSEMAYYYLLIFIKRLELLLPFSLLIGSIRTLCALNIHNEIVAMLASGIRLKTLLRPFLLVTLFFTFIIYCNYQFFLPNITKQTKKIEKNHIGSNRKSNNLDLYEITLRDNSIILYQEYQTNKNQFFDAYWIRSVDDIYRIKYLYLSQKYSKGFFVDHITRDKEGELALTKSYEDLSFPEIKFDDNLLQISLQNPSGLSILNLWNKLPKYSSNLYTEKEAQILSQFYTKMAMPWLCVLAFIAPAPYCIRFTRQLPVFLIYILAVFIFFAFYLIIDAAVIIGESQVIPPFWAIMSPFILFFGFFCRKYYKLT